MKNFSPILSLLALAGSADAAKHAAFADLSRGVLSFVQHGTRNIIADTREALQTLKGSQARRVLVLVESAYAAADAQFSANKRQPAEVASPIADAIMATCIAEFEANEASALTARKAKAAESKAKAEKAAKAAAAALSKAAKAVEPAKGVMTLAQTIEAFSAACAAGNDDALSALVTLAAAHLDAVETV